MNNNKAFFFDRDGTLIKDKNYLHDIRKIELFKNVIPTLKYILNSGYKIFILTNQSGIGRGYYTENNYLQTQNYLHNLFKKKDIIITETFYSPYYHNSKIPKYLENSHFRKPEPGMIISAAKKYNINLKESFMVGDKKSDIIAGKKAGCKTILLLTGKGKKEKENNPEIKPDYILSRITQIIKLL